MKQKIEFLVWLIICFWLGAAGWARGQGTAFTYQGRLNDRGIPANGTYDFAFTLYDGTGTNANVVAGPVGPDGVGVTNGLFLATIDFGSSSNNFPGAARWLGIGVRTNGSTNGFVAVMPFQPLTPTPYAITASNLSGIIPPSQVGAPLLDGGIAGTYSTVLSFINPSNQYTGNGGGLTDLNAAALKGSVPAATLTSVPSASLTGVISGAQLPPEVAYTSSSQTFTGSNLFTGANSFTNATNSFTGSFTGNGGGGLTNVSGISNFAISVQMLQPSVAGRLGPPLFGDGSDGNVTITTVSNLVRDMFYSNLTVTASGVLNTSGFRVFVYGTCTVTSPGVIQHNGGDGNLGTAGAGATTNTVGGGAAGAAGGTGSSGVGGNAGFGLGGVAGEGGGSVGFPGSPGGTVTAIPATNGGPNVLKTFPTAFSGRDLGSGIIAGGSGGGSGGGAGGITVGGAGGGGGGMLILAAPLITGTGTIQAKGGNGGNGAINGGQPSGGGGGGGGGCVVIISEQAPAAGVNISVAGGLGGTSPVHAGTNGAPGNIFLLY